MPVLRRSLLGAAGSSTSPLDAAVPALNMGFKLSWRPEADGECGQCERAGGLCGRRRRQEGHGPWTFACFRAAANPAWIPPKTPDNVRSKKVLMESTKIEDNGGKMRKDT
ncbi:unnamed protein product [Miscanthus lutarioriparius]|uniref:Wall-associated receptor kinase C-terminal domain-containing protein n=1 Tax=Miscanthus lutarioriparius TaxID=422564 RepID=A0A811NZU7_9POAL|nr:unnamed protein product [Miscanthus lutarioriparius]